MKFPGVVSTTCVIESKSHFIWCPCLQQRLRCQIEPCRQNLYRTLLTFPLGQSVGSWSDHSGLDRQARLCYHAALRKWFWLG